MAELIAKERLQPSLLDRLTDDEPDNAQESRERRVLSMRTLRQAVLRDLAWLFNSSGIGILQDLEAFPLAAQSVVNYGMPDFSGQTASGIEIEAVARRMRQAIWDFEPRILRNTVQVRPLSFDQSAHNRLIFELEGELWGQPVPERLFLKTELDLEMGEIRVTDFDAVFS
ncbi:type VI secretion system baseplate subunit TssE [Paraburkholderia xenovorans]|uniref:type VI secretion system baseplate subunit TssE n=1 Tax=Paraburkholderia xenovorans TaxID=36873 RepID=UPI0038BD7F41